MSIFAASFLCLIAILAITVISADAGGLKGASDKKLAKKLAKKPYSFSLTNGVWLNRNSVRSNFTSYTKFNDDFSYSQVALRPNAAGNEDTCVELNGIYNHVHKNKNPSVFDLSLSETIRHRPFGYTTLPTRFLFYSTVGNSKEFVLEATTVGVPSYNLTFSHVDSMPSCYRELRATVTWVAENPIISQRPMLTWMGPDIGLYASSSILRVNQHNHDGVVDDDTSHDWSGGFRDNLFPVVSETDGSTITRLSDIYPTPMRTQGCAYSYVAASFGDIFWTSTWCGKSNKLFQSNASFPSISVTGEVYGAVALSESILFVQHSHSIVKIDVTNNQILATKKGVRNRLDLAISSDHSTVYYLTDFRGDGHLVALNSTDLSVMRTYAVDVPAGYEMDTWYGAMIEITPTHFWISVRKIGGEDGDDGNNYYYDDGDDDEVSRNTMYLAHLTIPQQ